MPPRVTQPDHIGVRVRNLDAALAFYRDVLGLPLIERHTLPNGTELVFLAMGSAGWIELVYRADFAPAQPVTSDRAGLQHFCLQVDDLDAWIKHFEEKDVPLLIKPFTIPFPSGQARSLFVADPEGNPVELMERKRG